MKKDWEKLMDAFADSPTALVGDVDCTAEGEPLCGEFGVQGFPTIKYGDPTALEDYEGGRGYDELKAFADENLKPMCSPSNIDLCDDVKKAAIEKFMSMSDADLAAAVAEKEAAIEKLDKDFESGVEELQATYEKLQQDKEDGVKAIKESGLGLMKGVMALQKSKGSDEL